MNYDQANKKPKTGVARQLSVIRADRILYPKPVREDSHKTKSLLLLTEEELEKFLNE